MNSKSRHAEAEDLTAMYGAFCGGGRYARLLTAPSVGQGALRSKSAAQLDRDDALSYACSCWLVEALKDTALELGLAGCKIG